MLYRHHRQPRRGITLLEGAVVYPITFLLILGLIIGALGVFRYQEVAALARRGARYASTHGAQYRKDCQEAIGTAGTSCGTSKGFLWYQADPTCSAGSDTSWTGDIYDQAIRTNVVILDSSQMQVKAGWQPVVNLPNNPNNWPGGTVAVTVTYQWLPELFFIGPINLTSTSELPITN
jgi:hypothetical protein